MIGFTSTVIVPLLLVVYFVIFRLMRKDVGFSFDYVNRRFTPRLIALVATIAAIFHYAANFDCKKATNDQEFQCFIDTLYVVNFSNYPVGKKFSELPTINYHGSVPLRLLMHILPAIVPYFFWKWILGLYDDELQKKIYHLKWRRSDKVKTEFAESFHGWMKKGRWLRRFLLPSFQLVRLLQVSANFFQIVLLHFFFNLPVGWELMKLRDILEWSNFRTLQNFPPNSLCHLRGFWDGPPGRFECELGYNNVNSLLCFFLLSYFWALAIASSVHFIGSLLFWSSKFIRERWVRRLWKLTSCHETTREEFKKIFFKNYLRADGVLLIHLIHDNCPPSVVSKTFVVSKLANDLKEDA